MPAHLRDLRPRCRADRTSYQIKSGLTVCWWRHHDGVVTDTRALNLVAETRAPSERAAASNGRVSQEERTRAMRQRLLEATVECLGEHGWSGTSTTLVSRRAGVSRGAQLHHFPSKNDLVVAAVGHLAEMRGEELRQAAAALPDGPRRTRAVLQMLADHFTSPVFTAALELWVAGRTDPALHEAVAPLEQRIGRETHRMTVELLGVDESGPGARELVQATLDLVRGLGLANTITDDTARRSRILDEWAQVLDDRLHPDSSANASQLRAGQGRTNRGGSG